MFLLRIIVIVILILAAIPFINKAKDYFSDKKEKVKELNMKDIETKAQNLFHGQTQDKKIAQGSE